MDQKNALIVALPETAGSALYGMIDVFSAVGTLWQVLTGEAGTPARFQVRILAEQAQPFTCGNRIPVQPDCTPGDNPSADLLILPELWLAPSESLAGRHRPLVRWIRRFYAHGGEIYSACSGAILLAETGLLNGCPATSHWGYQPLFQREYPAIRFQPESNLVVADTDSRLVTAGGTTSWHDLALHIIARHAGPAEAVRIAHIYLLKWHAEGQLPYTPLLSGKAHADAAVRRCEQWLRDHSTDHDALAGLARASGLPERTLQRRFRRATGVSPVRYLQNLRIEQAKRLLEQTMEAADEISVRVGYEDASFFRRLFKRLTGVTPGHYRRLFRCPDGTVAG